MLAILAGAALLSTKPRLVVVLSIDQFRSDYLGRFSEYYLPPKSGNTVGGFRWLLANGANFVNARYRHIPTATGPGHAVIGTRSMPSITGIVGNEWYEQGKGKVYCVSDPLSKDIFTGAKSMSPRTLRVSTMSDELELATNGKSITVSMALKDRASILMAGHTADDVVWYDKPTGRWTTSDYYAKDLKLPGWAAEINAMKIPDKMRGKTWELSPEVKASGLTFETAKPGVPPGFGKSFPHQLHDDKAFYDTWTYTPFANDFVAQSAHQAVTNLGMGKDDVPDILTLNFSSNDYLGHRFGPNSPEVMQMSVDTDKAVSKILNDLQKNVTGGLSSVLFVLSADHGVVAVPEDLEARGIPGGRLSDEDETKKALAEKVGADALGMSDDGLIWFDHAKLALAGIDLAIAQRKAAEFFRADPRVFRVYTKSELPMVPVSDWIDEAAHRGIDAERGWDVAVIYKPGVYMYGGTGTGHGSPWIYDASVPLVFAGSGMKRGRQTDATGPEDIAATVCAELGIIAPSGSIGKAVGLLP